jgi:hypothetical protein
MEMAPKSPDSFPFKKLNPPEKGGGLYGNVSADSYNFAN